MAAILASPAWDWLRLSDMKLANVDQKEVQKKNFDRQHIATPLPTLSPGDPEHIKVEAEVMRPIGPRSDKVRTLHRRNRRYQNQCCLTPLSHLRVIPAVPSTLPSPMEDNFQMDLDPVPVKLQATTAQSASLLPPTPSAATSHAERTTARSGCVVKVPPKPDL